MINTNLPDAFQQVIGLGAQLAAYPARKSSRIGSAIFAVIFLLAAPLLLIGGLFYAYNRMQNYGQVVFLESLLPFLIISGLAVLVGLIAAWNAFTNWRKVMVIYQNGFAYNDRSGLQIWRWPEMDSLTAAVVRHYTNGVYTGTTHVYTMLKRNGQKLVINDTIEKVEEVSAKIRENTYPILFKEAVDKYNTGAPVFFGPVALSRSNGITVGKKNYPWDQVSKVTIHQGIIAVAKKDGGWFSGASVAASQVPNLELMLSIVDQVVGINPQKK